MNNILALLALSLSLYGSDLYQVSTFKALEEMGYEGTVSYEDIFKKGDFGIGTFDGTKGEMVALDGEFYQDAPDGRLSPVEPTQKAPFASVIFFKPEQTVKLKNVTAFGQLAQRVDPFLQKHNTPYAIKITGLFRQVKLRSLKKQVRPYKPLMQNDYEFQNIKGSLVGFWFPKYLDGIDFGGYHFHFIDEKKEWGGHILDFNLKSGIAELQAASSLTIDFPDAELFNQVNLERCP